MTLTTGQRIWYKATTGKDVERAWVVDPEPERYNMLCHRPSKRQAIRADVKYKVRVENPRRGQSPLKTIPLSWIERGMRMKGEWV